MTHLTANEIDVINGIAYAEMSPANGSTPERIEDTGTWCWADRFSDKLTVSQVKGVLGSLVQKRMIWIRDNRGDDNEVGFTEAGFAAWQANDRGTA